MSVLVLVEAQMKARDEVEAFMRAELSATRGYDGCEGLTVHTNLDDSNNLVIKKYLQENFGVIINGRVSVYEFLGTELDEDVIWCYMEIPKVKKLKSIEVMSKILTEVHEDQMNLIHVKNNGKIKTVKSLMRF